MQHYAAKPFQEGPAPNQESFLSLKRLCSVHTTEKNDSNEPLIKPVVSVQMLLGVLCCWVHNFKEWGSLADGLAHEVVEPLAMATKCLELLPEDIKLGRGPTGPDKALRRNNYTVNQDVLTRLPLKQELKEFVKLCRLAGQQNKLRHQATITKKAINGIKSRDLGWKIKQVKTKGGEPEWQFSPPKASWENSLPLNKRVKLQRPRERVVELEAKAEQLADTLSASEDAAHELETLLIQLQDKMFPADCEERAKLAKHEAAARAKLDELNAPKPDVAEQTRQKNKAKVAAFYEMVDKMKENPEEYWKLKLPPVVKSAEQLKQEKAFSDFIDHEISWRATHHAITAGIDSSSMEASIFSEDQDSTPATDANHAARASSGPGTMPMDYTENMVPSGPGPVELVRNRK
jgi:hypothetical protein